MSITVSSSPSPFVSDVSPITETDEELRRILQDAEVAPLLPALAYLTGDLSLLRPELRPDPLMLVLPQSGLDDAQQATARELALEALIKYRDGGCQPAAPPSDEDLQTILEFTVGGAEMAAYLPLLEEELA